MKRSSRALSVAALVVVLLSLLLMPLSLVQHPVAAATPPPAVSGGARIDEPRAQSVVRGIVRVMGTASTGDFNMYQMYIQRPGSGAFEWKFERNSPVVNGVLWEWSTNQRDYPDGNYVIRMWVVRKDGNYDEVTVAVRVDNSSTATPSPTATRASSPTPARTPTPIVISTPQVIGVAPTATLAPTRVPATPTPLFGIDVAKVIDPMPWVRAFTTGMVLALGAIGFIVALFVARALLRWRP